MITHRNFLILAKVNIDDEQIIVANRQGDATIFKLPSNGGNYELLPTEVIRSGDVLTTPGADSINRKGQGFCEALICSTWGNTVTRHVLKLSERRSLESSEVLLKKWLDIPDGVSICEPWIAISNHNAHSVYLYDSTVLLNQYSEPAGILRCFRYPHGLQFTSDGRYMLVADAAAPNVHLYMQDRCGWRGVRNPLHSMRVLSDEDFLRGRSTDGDGGPKGVDIDNSMSIFVTTCEVRPLAFFNLTEILDWISSMQVNDANGSPGLEEKLYAFTLCEKHSQDQGLGLEIEYGHQRNQAKQALAALMNSRSWRITAPLRWISAHWPRALGS